MRYEAKAAAQQMLKNGAWRVFLAGALCGTVVTATVGAAWVWWKPAECVA